MIQHMSCRSFRDPLPGFFCIILVSIYSQLMSLIFVNQVGATGIFTQIIVIVQILAYFDFMGILGLAGYALVLQDDGALIGMILRSYRIIFIGLVNDNLHIAFI